MWLRRYDTVRWEDLPHIESAFFAISEVEREPGDFGWHRIFGVENLLWEGARFHHPPSPEERAWAKQQQWERLREQMLGYEVVLVKDQFHPPLRPVFQWDAKDAHPWGREWVIDARDARERSRLERLLRGVRAPAPAGGTNAGEAVMVAGLGGALKGILQGVKKAGSADQTPDVPKPPPVKPAAPLRTMPRKTVKCFQPGKNIAQGKVRRVRPAIAAPGRRAEPDDDAGVSSGAGGVRGEEREFGGYAGQGAKQLPGHACRAANQKSPQRWPSQS